MTVKLSTYYEGEKLAETPNTYSILQHAKVDCLKRRLA